ncbi:MAG: hypothetical protein ACLQME_12635 [Alphaproteobacteria bacterium]
MTKRARSDLARMEAAAKIEAMNKAEDYAARGRRFADLSDDVLSRRCAETFRAVYLAFDYKLGIEFDDLESEAFLRGMEALRLVTKADRDAIYESLERDWQDPEFERSMRERADRLLNTQGKRPN